MPKLSILHISDIHIGNTFPNESVEDIAIRTVDDIKDNAKEIDCVVVTGDIFDGKESSGIDKKGENFKINEAVSFFNKLLDELKAKKIAQNLEKKDFVFVPGNHDLERDGFTVNFDKYKRFLSKFQSLEYFTNNYNETYLYTIKLLDKQKIAIIGFNSCMVEPFNDHNIECIREIKWGDGTFSTEIQEAIKTKIKDYYREKWDDYGKIELNQLSEAFDILNSKINIKDYTIIACFHHHFYPFPENYDVIGDRSLMRNFDDVIKKLQRNNVKIVLHGHKHLPIIRPITNKAYLNNPDSVMYVFSTGSFAKKGEEQSFQIIDVYSPRENKIADVTTFNYKKKDLFIEKYSIPPKRKYGQDSAIEILELFSSEFSLNYKRYHEDVKEKDIISSRSGIDEIIKSVGNAITPFERVKTDLQDNYKNILVLLLSIHYRINALNQTRNSSNESKEILYNLSNQFEEVNILGSYKQNLLNILQANTNSEFEIFYPKIENNASQQEKKFTAYAIIASFFTDLYLTLRQYGDFYYKHERINLNIKFPENNFHTMIPVPTIHIHSETDRRAVFINFKCKDPTVHKIAILILKDFEKKLSKVEDSFRILGLKIYYLTPRVEKDAYDLENYNFEAYIPTLLPLLTGENLYTQKEVFARELIQNSMDAILLRETLDTEPFNKTIKIELGIAKDSKDGKLRKYFKITDEGIGMDTFKIERYFTSIGRSFYISEEFAELKRINKLQFEPVSIFGIGFLSVFMVSSEINVKTKIYDNSDSALEINIPNYDGCFFINKIVGDEINEGTSITLYENEKRLLDFNEIKKYIRTTFSDFQLKIEIIDNENNSLEEIRPYSIRDKKEFSLFLPMSENGFEQVSWKTVVKEGKRLEHYKYGLFIDFNPSKVKNAYMKNDILSDNVNKTLESHDKLYLNSGIKLSEQGNFGFKSFNCTQFYNLPASYVQLNVAREKINSFKNEYYNDEKAIILLSEQANELISFIQEERKDNNLVFCDNIYLFFKTNNLPREKLNKIKQKLFHLSVKSENNWIFITLQPNKQSIEQLNDMFSGNQPDSIDYEINSSFNIVNLLLLKCKLFMKRLQIKDNNNNDIELVEYLIRNLLKIGTIPLSECLDQYKRDKKLIDFVSSIYNLDIKLFDREWKNIDGYNKNYMSTLMFELPNITRSYFSGVYNKEVSYNDKLYEIEQNFLAILDQFISNIDFFEINSRNKENAKNLLEDILFVLFSAPSHKERSGVIGNDYKYYILNNYLRLVAFYRITSTLLKIHQVYNFTIKLRLLHNKSDFIA